METAYWIMEEDSIVKITSSQDGASFYEISKIEGDEYKLVSMHFSPDDADYYLKGTSCNI